MVQMSLNVITVLISFQVLASISGSANLVKRMAVPFSLDLHNNVFYICSALAVTDTLQVFQKSELFLTSRQKTLHNLVHILDHSK